MGKCFSTAKSVREEILVSGTSNPNPETIFEPLPPPQPRPLKPAIKKSKPTTTTIDRSTQYRLLRLLDGDTFDCYPENKGADTVVRVRIARANAPEIKPLLSDPLHDAHKECGQLVSAFVMELLADKLLTLDPLLTSDKWPGRVDCEVILPDGQNLSDILLVKGYATKMGLRGHRDPWTAEQFKHILNELSPKHLGQY